MDKLQLTRQNLGRVFNFRFGHLHAEHILVLSSKTAKLKAENSAKTASRFSHISYCAPRIRDCFESIEFHYQLLIIASKMIFVNSNCTTLQMPQNICYNFN